MQSNWGRPTAGARAVGIYRQCGRLCVLVLGFAVSACANLGQIGNLTEGPHITVAVESVDAPAAVSEKFLASLKGEAVDRNIVVVAPGEANYRLRGYLAAHVDGGVTSVAWAWDVYDIHQRRAFRLNGTEASPGAGWSVADDQVLRRIARASLDQLAVLAAARPSTVAANESAPPPATKRSAMFGWIDDWAPETAGILRVFKRESKPEIVDAGIALPPPGEVPMPQGRPEPGTASARLLAFAPDE
jgi:hypothetical protein